MNTWMFDKESNTFKKKQASMPIIIE